MSVKSHQSNKLIQSLNVAGFWISDDVLPHSDSGSLSHQRISAILPLTCHCDAIFLKISSVQPFVLLLRLVFFFF